MKNVFYIGFIQRFTLQYFAGLSVVGKLHDLFLVRVDIRYLLLTNAIFSLQIGSFFSFSHHKIIDCLSFIERTDPLKLQGRDDRE